MAAAPTVIRRVYKDNFLKNMREERDIQRARLHENVVQMSSLERRCSAAEGPCTSEHPPDAGRMDEHARH